MADVTHLDGNALAGALVDVFGRDMTGALGACANCGALNAVGVLLVYRAGLGEVVRCPACSTVLLVLTSHGESRRVYFASLRWLDPSGAT